MTVLNPIFDPMGKRLIRLQPGQLAEKLPGLGLQKVQVVTKNQLVYFGTIVSHNALTITLKDLTSHSHRFPINQIQELVYDVEASW